MLIPASAALERADALLESCLLGEVSLDDLLTMPIDWQALASERRQARRRSSAGLEALPTSNPLVMRSGRRDEGQAASPAQHISPTDLQSTFTANALSPVPSANPYKRLRSCTPPPKRPTSSRMPSSDSLSAKSSNAPSSCASDLAGLESPLHSPASSFVHLSASSTAVSSAATAADADDDAVQRIAAAATAMDFQFWQPWSEGFRVDCSQDMITSKHNQSTAGNATFTPTSIVFQRPETSIILDLAR